MFAPVVRLAKDLWTNHKKEMAIFAAVIIVMGAVSLIWGTP